MTELNKYVYLFVIQSVVLLCNLSKTTYSPNLHFSKGPFYLSKNISKDKQEMPKGLNEAQPSRGTERRGDEEQTMKKQKKQKNKTKNKTKQNKKKKKKKKKKKQYTKEEKEVKFN